MGSSKKHKRNKSERRTYEEYNATQDPCFLQRGLKLILKVGSCSTPEYTNSPPLLTSIGPPTAAEAMMSVAPSSPMEETPLECEEIPERHKKSKKKKKKKDRERKHKHHKEKRHRDRRRDLLSVEHTVMDDYEDDISEIGKISRDLRSPKIAQLGSAIAVDAESSQDGFSYFGDDNSSQPPPETVLLYSSVTTDNSPSCQPVSKPIITRKNEDISLDSPSSPSLQSISGNIRSPSKESASINTSSPSTSAAGAVSYSGKTCATLKSVEAPRTPGSHSDSGREPRTCVLKLKQQRTPLNKLLDHLLRSLEKRDPHNFFAWPVTDDIAPGYSSIIDKPMDFSSMRQKIDEHAYTTLTEFSDDFKLICDNAIHYNHVDTVYNKAAKRLWQTGSKMLQPESLVRTLKPLSGYIRELTHKELGFDLRSNEYAGFETQDSGDECASAKMDETISALQEEDEKRRLLQQENEPKTRFEPYTDNLTPEQILAQAQSAANKAKARLDAQGRGHNLGFLRQNKDGTTTLNILSGNEIKCPERIVNIGDLVGKLTAGSGQMYTAEEDERNKIKPLKALNYGPFSSFAPTYDSRFSTLTQEDTQLVLNTYGDAASAEYADSLIQFSKDSSYATILANKLLDIMTNNEHSKCLEQLRSVQLGKYEEQEIGKCFNSVEQEQRTTNNCPETREQIEMEFERYKTTRIDYNRLRTLKELGIDVSFLDMLESESKNFELSRRLHEHLSNNLKLIDKLRTVQHERLSQPPPSHLSQVAHPTQEETHIAQEVTQHLTDIAKKLPPNVIADPYALRKAMGMSYVGLPPPPESAQRLVIPEILQQPVVIPQTFCANVTANESAIGEGALPIEIDDEFDDDLREFLDNGSDLHVTSPADENNIVTQFLLN